MLNEKLQAVVERLADLPGDAQDELAAQIEAWLLDRQWDALLEDPIGDAFIAELKHEAQAGPLYPWPGK
ncbi:MAG TPA: hypothetical protein VMV29_12565 [Ktedonobacterales bacterium]|nr:hypothetical protein [Ktedonobacterales bacterium]